MNIKTLFRHTSSTLVILSVLFAVSCASSPRNERLNSMESLHDAEYRIFSIPDEDEDYIYLRIYNPSYRRRFSGGSLLQSGINIVEVRPMITSHVALGFDLNDEFYGLTAYSRPNLAMEECGNTSSNLYMKTCDSKKSLQTLLAMKVTREEKESMRSLVMHCMEEELVVYDTFQNFKVASKKINDAIHHRPKAEEHTVEARADFIDFSTVSFEEEVQTIKVMDFFEDRKNPFVCSNFAAWVLYRTVPETRRFFNENFTDLMLVGPSDVASVPGFEPVFTSTWASYRKAIRKIKEERRACVSGPLKMDGGRIAKKSSL